MSEERGGGVIGATAFAFVFVTILTGLGIWQLQRKAWKENLIATVTARVARAPESLPPPAEWPRLHQDADEFRHVTFSAEFLPGEDALVYTAGSNFRPDVHGGGYWVFAPARLSNGAIVLIDRGFVSFDRKDAASAQPAGPGQIVGVMRWPEKPGLFTPAAEPQNNVWYLRDTAAIAAAKKWDATAPFYVEQESPMPPSGLPRPGKLVVALPDNHLQYALTWFGLALGLCGVYGVWLAKRWRMRPLVTGPRSDSRSLGG